MKKNLLSIIILSLLVVNIGLTAVMMFSVTNTNKKTAEIVTKIATILDLEIEGQSGSNGASEVSLADTAAYSITDKMTITLKRDEGDTQDHYCIVNVTLSMDMNHEDYATLGDLSTKEDIIKGEIVDVIGGYTLSEAQLSQKQMCDEILQRVQALYGSDFIYKVSFSEIMFG